MPHSTDVEARLWRTGRSPRGRRCVAPGHGESFDSDVIAAATGLRAEFGLRTVDAIHAASALRCGCVAALTGDAAWSRVPALRIEVVRR